jgi:hypothetical protein
VAVVMQQQRRQERLLQRQQQQQQQRPTWQQQGPTSVSAASTDNCTVGCASAVEPVCVAGNVTVQNPCLAQCQGLTVLQQGSCTEEGEGSSAGKDHSVLVGSSA